MNEARRLALVTGGAQGLGRAIAARLAADGARVIVADIQSDGAQAAAKTIDGEADALPLVIDVADERSVAGAYEQIDREFGRLDILVNNAGIGGVRVPLEKMPLSDWERVMRVNLTGAFLMARGAIPLMRRNKWGRIVNVASQAARARTSAGKSQYAASKAGMVGFARVLADEVAQDGITVNCVCPSRTMTPLTIESAGDDTAYFSRGAAQTAIGRLAEPADTAHAVAFFCSEQSGFFTGAVVDVTGGAFMP